MPNKKQIKNISKKIIISTVGILTVISMTGGPALAAAPQATQVAVTQNVARIIFDQNVGQAPDASNSPDLVNFSLESPTGISKVLSGLSPYSQWTSYNFVSESNNGISQIYGLNSLNLSVGQPFRLSFNNITNADGEFVTPSSVDGTVTLGPQLDNITPLYAKAGDQVFLSGTRFSNEILTTPDVWIAGTQASVVSTTTASIDGVVMITGVTITVPTGLSTAYGGSNLTNLVNQDTVLSTNSRPLYFYNSNFGVLTGTIIETIDSTTSQIDGAEVQAYKDNEPWSRYTGKTQNNGIFAIVAPAGTYNLIYVTPGSGATKAAPIKSTGKVVTANSITNLGETSFVAPTISGKIYGPDGTTPAYGARVTVHNQNWSVEQQARSGSDGAYRVYVPPSTTAPQYIIDVEPSDYDRNVNNYLMTSATQDVPAAGPYTKNINLATENVFGVIKTPTGTTSESNPFPDAAVPGARVHLFKSDWSFDRWADTVRQGANIGRFSFGGVPAGTYILEIEPPFCGDPDTNVSKYCGYARTRFEGVSITTGSNDLGTKRFSAPNYYGYVYVDSNSNGQYDQGEGQSNAWVNMMKEGFWTGSSTDANGRFAFALPGTGGYRIEVQPPAGYAFYSADLQVLTLPLTSPHYIRLSTPNVSGYVYGPTGTTGQPWTWVDLCPINAPGACYGSGTNESGLFSANAPNGTWQLQVHPNWDSFYVAPQPKTVVVEVGTVSTVDGDTNDADEPLRNDGKIIIRLIDPATDPNSFTGTVYDPTETTPQQNIGIGLRPAVTEGSSCRGDGMSRWTQTNNQGKYAFADVLAGLYEIEAMPWGTSDYSRVRVCHTITAEAATRTKNIPLTAPNITGTIATPAGSVSDENPTPDTAVANAWVSLFIEGPMGPGGGWYGGNANENGLFALGGVPGGTYTLEVQPQWGTVYSSRRYTNVTLTDSDSNGIADTTNLNTLIGTTSDNFPAKAIRVGTPNIKGRIMNPGPDGDPATASDNEPVRGVWVMVHKPDWSQNAGGNTDDNGYFRVGGLANGTYQIEVNLSWGGEQAYVAPSGLSVEITGGVGVIKQAGTPLTNNVITLTPPTKTVSGKVYKDLNGNNQYDSGEGVANARVEGHRDMGGGFFETRTGTDGSYSLKLSGGAWWIETRPDWGGATQADWVYTEPPTRISFAENSTTESQELNFKVTVADATITGTVKTPTDTAVQWAWVDLRGKGMGNGTNTDNNGRFSIKIPAGTYTVSVFSSLADYGSPDPKSVTVASGKMADAGTLYLKAKNAHIKGFVQDDAGNPVQNVVINSWLFDKPGWAMTYTDQTGAYDLSVWSGTWGVMVIPMSQNYVYVGTPQKVTVASNETSNGNNFQLKLANKTLKVRVKKSDLTNVTDIWGGVWVRDTSVGGGMLDFGGPMEDMMGKAGMTAPMGPGMEKGGFTGGGLMNGYTEIKVPAGTYEVGLGMPPGSRYTLTSTQTVTMAATDTSKDVDLIVKVNDATISGYFYLDADNDGLYDTGEEVTGLRAFIHADRVGGGWQFSESNPTTGSYTLSVAGGNWYVDAFIDPFMVFGGTNQYLVINEDITVTVADAGSATYNFKVKRLDATIQGTVLNPDGSPMTSTDYGLVWVFVDFGSAEMIEEFKGPGGPGLGTFTNVDGTYSLKVPAGTYKIGVGLPPWDTRDLLNPDMITVTVASGATSTGNNLQFRESNVTISGTVYLDANANGTVDSGEAKAGFVRAWSDGGRGTGTITSDGSYSLKAIQGDTWHIVAVSEINGVYYQSAEAAIATVAGTISYTRNLALVSKNIAVLQGVSATFDASQSKTIKLTKSDGTDEVVLEIPAGAIATSGTITVSITPTVNVKPDAKDKPISLAYDFEARDANRNEIENFVQNVTIYMYYEPDLIAAAGYSVESITPKYYDDRTGTWENYSNVVRDTANNRFIIKTDHFSEGGFIGGGAVPSAPANLTASALSSSSIALSWTDNSNNETGFKVYRGGSLIATTSANAVSYTDTNLSASTTYSYYVKATNASGDSAASNTAQATTLATGEEQPTPSGAVIRGAEAQVEVPVEELVVEEKAITEMTAAEKTAKIAEVKTQITQARAQLIVLIRELIILIQAQIVELQAQLAALQAGQ